MEVFTYCKKFNVEFSDCDIYGHMNIHRCLCWFENIRFEISRNIGMDAFFHPKHIGIQSKRSEINHTGEYFIMPLLWAHVTSIQKIPVGITVWVHTWIEEPISACCTFHHCITNENNNIFLNYDCRIGLVGNRSGLVREMPELMYEMIMNFISSIPANPNKSILEIVYE